MKQKLINLLKLIICFGLFLYITSIVKKVFFLIGINVSNLSPVLKALIEFFISLFLLIISVLIYRKDLQKDFNEFKCNWKNKILFSLKLFGIFILLKISSGFLASFLAVIFNIELTSSENQMAINDLLEQFPVLIIFGAVVFAPIYEETLFRFGFKKVINNKYLFILVSGLLFGFIHIFPTDLNLGLALIQAVPYVTMGLCLAYYYQKTNNICYSILLHFYNNLLSMMLLIVMML